jgi:hypothetical protein
VGFSFDLARSVFLISIYIIYYFLSWWVPIAIGFLYASLQHAV